MMVPETLEILSVPGTQEPFRFEYEPEEAKRGDGVLVSEQSGQRFPVRGGIPEFVSDEQLHGANRTYGRLYDRIAWVYDWQYAIWSRLFHGGEEKVRRQYLSELSIRPSDRVLDVSVGTGADLRFCPRDALFYGVDISWGMLRRCRTNASRWGIDVHLFKGLAEALPFREAVFDSVFHAGGINYFSDKAAAVQEMARVAKPGAKVVIVDATEKLSRAYERIPFARRFVQERGRTMDPPVDAVPAAMEDVRVSHVCKGQMYCLRFRKPI